MRSCPAPAARKHCSTWRWPPCRSGRGKGPRPAVVMPNPFYHVYAGAAAVAGAEPVFLPANRENGFLPETDLIPPEALSRTALAYVCSPSNPQGAIASPEYLGRWLKH